MCFLNFFEQQFLHVQIKQQWYTQHHQMLAHYHYPTSTYSRTDRSSAALGNQAFNHSSMGRRWMKLLVLALTVSHLSHQLLCIGFLGTSNVGDAQIRSGKIVRAASPVADGLGVASAVASLTDFFFRCLDYYKKNLKHVAALEQFGDVDNHANRLFQQIKESRSVIVPSLQGLPKQPIRDTKFTALMREILRDTKTAGISAVYAEPGVGKSVAVAVAIQAEYSKSAATTALLQGNFEKTLEDFFRVCDAKRANDVAWRLFSLLRASNKRLHIIFDNTFDNGVDKTGKLMDLARAAFAHGHHIIAITQFKKSAEEIADLNGERTRLAPQQQQDDRTYRWSRRQAQNYLETMEEEVVSPNEPKEREEFIGKVLNDTQISDDVGLWRPVAINAYMNTGRKPKAPQRAPGAKLRYWELVASVGDLAILALISTSVLETSSEWDHPARHISACLGATTGEGLCPETMRDTVVCIFFRECPP